MIHIATVHWQTCKWINIQEHFLKKFISSDYRIYAILPNSELNDIDLKKFFYYKKENHQTHAENLNYLSKIILQSSKSDDDLIIFIDGDAFPIKKMPLEYHSKLVENKILSVQRLENNGDIQPHPCFTLTTIRFWKILNVGWEGGYKWKDLQGSLITDVGGNLLKRLKELNVEWYPMLRTNKKNLHPLLFGVYDDFIYHHGVGFRKGIGGRVVRQLNNIQYEKKNIFIKYLGFHVKNKYLLKIRNKYIPFFRKNLGIINEQTKMNEYYYEKIKNNDYFFYEFI